MKIQATFWSQLKRALTEIVDDNGAALEKIDRVEDSSIDSASVAYVLAASDLFKYLSELPNAAEVTFSLGRKMIRPTAFGELSMCILLAPTVADAVRALARFSKHDVPLIDLAYQETTTEGRISIGFRQPVDSKSEALIVAFCVCMAETKIERLTGRARNIKKLELTQSSKGYEPHYRKYLLLSPKIDHGDNVIVLNRPVLDSANPHADPIAFDNFVSAFISREELKVAAIRIEVRVRERVMSNIRTPPSIAQMASSLRLSNRQLRSALSKEETSYQEIVRSCRIEYATALFRNPALSLSDISHRLGYSELSAFTHAFIRWTGKSPSAYRIDLLSRLSV